MRVKKGVVIIFIISLFLQTLTNNSLNSHSSTLKVNAEEKTVTLVGDLQSELSAVKDWDPADPGTQMVKEENGRYKLSGTMPAGTYEYKIAINGSWDENYGADGERNGANYKLTIEKETNLTFIYDDTTHIVTVLMPLPKDELPRIVGDIQPYINAGPEWSPEESTAFLSDDDNDNIYTYRVEVPKGKHEFKIVLGNSWEKPTYPQENFTLNILKNTEITFFYNHGTKAVSTDYDAGLPDGSVQGDKLYHNTWEKLYRYPFGAVKTGDKVKLRLRAKKGDLSAAKVQLKNYNTGNTKSIDMDYSGWANLDDSDVEFWEANVTPDEKGVYGYKFIARDGDHMKEYGEDPQEGNTGTAVDSNAGLFQMTVYDPQYKTPDWMKEAVVYQIFPDRFFNGNKKNDKAKNTSRGPEPIEQQDWNELPDNPRLIDREGYDGDGIWSNDFYGGDIAGIQKKLDYIESLGVNTLYLNPINHAASNHKYDATDYKAMDPMFGSPEEFNEFTKELKKRGMHLILDGVFNHVGDDSIYFDRYGKYKTVGAYEYWSRVYDLVNKGTSEKDAKLQVEEDLKNQGQQFSPYGFHTWFNIENEKVNGVYKYQAWWGYDSLPEIKSIPGKAVDYNSELNNRPFADYIMYEDDSAAKSWLKRGASGWRLDVANEVDPEFWREFRKELKKGKKIDPLILGEIWDDASEYFLGDLYDSVMNYRFRGAMIDYLKNGNAQGASDALNAVQEDYPAESFQALMNLMGSHDTPRATFILGNGTDSYERAEHDSKYDHILGIKRLKLAAILQMGYPGAPTIYYGDEAGATGSKDPDDRRTYPWGKENQALIKHYQSVGKIRKQHSDLFAYGDLKTLYSKDDVMVYARTDKKNAAIIATNRGNNDQMIELDTKDLLVNDVNFEDQLNKKYKVKTENGKLKITVPAMSGRMLVSQKGQNLKRPSAVKQLSAQEGTHTVKLQWKGDAKSYNVYQTTISGALYKQVATTTKNNVTIDGLDNGRKYYFAVTAVDKGNNESTITEIEKAAIPHVKLTNGNYDIENVSTLINGTIDLSQQQNINGEIFIDGETDSGLAEGLIAQLHVKAPGETDWSAYPAQYTDQKAKYNVFTSGFLPLTAGDYQYKYMFSTDLGRNWAVSETKTVTYSKGEDTSPPAESVTLKEPPQESGQVNLSWKMQEATDPYMIAIVRDGKIIERLFNTTQSSYKDMNVTNGQTYVYEVLVYDQFGNYVTSDKVSIMPDLVTVEVTFKVHAPDYTPQDTKITIPGSKNGWNTGAWEMTRNGAVTNDFEYTIEAQEGEVLTYKYVKDGSWDKEGLADHTPGNPNDDDISYYGYGAQGTDMSIVVSNQGGNKMVIQDNIQRWIDQPVMITSHNDGQTVTTDTILLKGNAIKEGVLTINGESVKVHDDMSFTHAVTLKNGNNELNIHIEPSEENKATIFKNDGGAISKNTKDIKLSIIKK
ncbi:alpha-amylase family glycosyl hydrolase [Bacillus sp. CECT 9360]|uniref:alpha-amylase family glycosyl hydrolase n=1 Tax=Bacillus sp. CECT 9360 TaxID=2845821 RepID=UPI001E3B7AA8|nr:alpha-amylase family glycosyl hydrolase [Bacillus sp. CECT 9360]CAH0344100.1 Amylopullulanase [Bacillus sp. CECT 9360]